MSAIDDLIHEGPVPIDGGFATELQTMDYDLTSDLWSARLLQEAGFAKLPRRAEYVNHVSQRSPQPVGRLVQDHGCRLLPDLRQQPPTLTRFPGQKAKKKKPVRRQATDGERSRNGAGSGN